MRRPARWPGRRWSVRRLVRCALRSADEDRAWRAVMTLQRRRGDEILDEIRALARSRSAWRRALALDVAAQWRLERGDEPVDMPAALRDELAILLRAGLRDPHVRVRRSAASALGHRPDPTALDELTVRAAEPDSLLRWHVAVALGRYSQPAAIACLLRLARDPDDAVRDWATFGLGTMHETLDTPEIRALLWLNLTDPDPDVRGEALVGLAARREAGIVAMLIDRLGGDDPRGYELESAELLAQPALLPVLRKLSQQEAGRHDYWASCLRRAIAACEVAAPQG